MLSVTLRDIAALLLPRVRFGVEPTALPSFFRLSISFFNSLNLYLHLEWLAK